MIIRDIRIQEINIPLVTPFNTALRTVETVNDIIIRIETDTGHTGFGEAPPTAVITGETKGSIVAAIRDYIAPSIKGMDIEDMDGIMKKIHTCIVKNTSAKGAVDMAVYDLFAKNLNRPLYKLLGGHTSEIETDLTISMNDTKKMVEDSIKAIEHGFNILKIKVGRDKKSDIDSIAAIRKEVGKDIVLRVDANQGWNIKESIQIIREMEDKDLQIDLVEQPVNAHDFEGMKQVTSCVYTPILADESVFSFADAVKIIQNRGADIINIKLMKTGGIYEALKICSLAENFNIECMIGCMLESKIAVSAAAHLAAAKSIITRADLDGPTLCKVDPYLGGPIFQGSKILMQETAGIGIVDIDSSFIVK
ncbi:MAG: dipeptide epimerase [Lachnospiraceae bacterium]